MKDPAPLRCDLHGTVYELPIFFEQLDAWAYAFDVPLDLSVKLHLMLDELLTNIAIHAYAGKGGDVSVQVEFFPPHTLQSVIRDQGPAFDPTCMPAPDIHAFLDEREIGGLGVHFVQTLADRFSYRRDGDCNEVTLIHSLTLTDTR